MSLNAAQVMSIVDQPVLLNLDKAQISDTMTQSLHTCIIPLPQFLYLLNTGIVSTRILKEIFTAQLKLISSINCVIPRKG